MRPLIGISQCLDDRGHWRPGRRYEYLDCAYSHAIDEAGGAPIHLPIQQDAEAIASRIDGLLIPGGDDFQPPRSYPSTVRFESAPEARVAFDLRLLEATQSRGMPVLAICYGMQLLARARGGSLHYDIPSDVPDADDHQLSEPGGRHGLRVTPDTRLAAIVGATPEPVNSLHHQAVALPGDGLLVSARAADGLIEALESESGPFCVGVQWHPEKLEGLHRTHLFGAFVEACRR
ncbi:MAG: gamma-glutamyl-gamma-aminobutyrate hydrolase family protein [Myxococcota bacterium]